MQKGPAQVTSGNIAPTITGPQKDKDVFVVLGLVVSLAAVIGAFWYYSSTDHTGPVRISNGSKSAKFKWGQPEITSHSLSHPPPTQVQKRLPQNQASSTPISTSKSAARA